MSKNSYVVGLLLIGLGAVLLLGKAGMFNFAMGVMWPIFVLLPSLFFHILFFARGVPSGVLVPGGILATYALMFFYCNLFGWHAMAWLWPGFIGGVAVGLFEAYYFNPDRPRPLFIGAAIVASVSAVFFGFTLLATVGMYVIAAGMIALGVWIMYRRPRS